VPHFLLVCGETSQPVGVVVMEAPSMLQAHTSAVAGDLAGGPANDAEPRPWEVLEISVLSTFEDVKTA
jgi:hypothetical protein